jgi:WD40 repeat protein
MCLPWEDRDDLLRTLEIEPGQKTFLTGHSDSVPSVAFSPDGKALASASADKTIRLWDVRHPYLGHPRLLHCESQPAMS